MIYKFTHITRSGIEMEISVPGERIVCPSCNGSGTELCGGLKGAAFSADEMYEDPDFSEDYCGGKYDVACSECHGKNVVTAPDESRMSKRQMILWGKFCQNAAEYAAEKRMRERGIQF